MSWGWKIAVLYGLFVAMTLSMVFYFARQDVDLVATDYYKQEIEYQDQIDKINNARALKEAIEFQYLNELRKVKLTFPKAHVKSGISGKIQFYRPSNADEDREYDIQPIPNGDQLIGVGSLKKGFWKIKIHWSAGGKEFYDEKVVTL